MDEDQDKDEDADEDKDEDEDEDEDEDAALSRCRSATARPLPSPLRSCIPGSVSGSPGIPNPGGAGTRTPLDRLKRLAGVLELGLNSCRGTKLRSLSL